MLVMIFSSCICCCSYFALCSSEAPSLKAIKVCGIIGCIISFLATSIFVGWVALGTYFVVNIHGAGSVCRNTILYLALLYVYLLVMAIAGGVVVVSRCNDWRKDSGSGHLRRSLVRRRKSKYDEVSTCES